MKNEFSLCILSLKNKCLNSIMHDSARVATCLCTFFFCCNQWIILTNQMQKSFNTENNWSCPPQILRTFLFELNRCKYFTASVLCNLHILCDNWFATTDTFLLLNNAKCVFITRLELFIWYIFRCPLVSNLYVFLHTIIEHYADNMNTIYDMTGKIYNNRI